MRIDTWRFRCEIRRFQYGMYAFLMKREDGSVETFFCTGLYRECKKKALAEAKRLGDVVSIELGI
jgi:hypothetical protein